MSLKGAGNPQIAAITGGTGVPIKVNTSGVSFIGPPTGTMGNNGAYVSGTAFTRTIPKCWMYWTAGQIAAGVPATAGWYYAEGSSSTAFTVFNNTYTSGDPAYPTNKVAFVTTGTGAITGDTGEEFGPTYSLPILNVNSQVIFELLSINNNSAGTKMARFRASGTAGQIWTGITQTTNVTLRDQKIVQMCGDVTKQVCFAPTAGTPFGQTAGALTYGTENFGVATTGVFSLQRNTATDYMVLEMHSLSYLS